MNEKTRTEASLNRMSNQLEFIVHERAGAVSLSQEGGSLTPTAEVRLKASPRGRGSERAFKSVYIRGKSGDGPHDVREDGGIVQGFMRAIDGELEIAFLVPESRFPSFALETSLFASSEVRIIVWPFEDLKSWDGESTLFLREVEILALSVAQ